MVISIAMMIVYPRVFNLPKIVEHLWPARSPGFSKIVVVLSLQLLYAFVFYEIQGNRPNPVLYHHFLHENDNSHYIGGFCIIFPDISIWFYHPCPCQETSEWSPGSIGTPAEGWVHCRVHKKPGRQATMGMLSGQLDMIFKAVAQDTWDHFQQMPIDAPMLGILMNNQWFPSLKPYPDLPWKRFTMTIPGMIIAAERHHASQHISSQKYSSHFLGWKTAKTWLSKNRGHTDISWSNWLNA